MYLNNNSIEYQNFQDFEKYARFISNKFDINIQLEAAKAETDGNTIYLPNIMSMTKKELDMMYAILLHEVGHIRHSSFLPEDFAKLKTQGHAFLANSIEDARIENLLMKDFGGAQEMFDKLYTDYTQDKQLLKKVFNYSGSVPDFFSAFALYVHNCLVDCKTSSLVDIAGKKNEMMVRLFFKRHQIDFFLENAPLNNWDDVVELTNYLYDLFISEHKDKTQKLSLKEDLAHKSNAEKNMQKLYEKVEQAQAHVDDITGKIEDLEQQIAKFDEENEPIVSQLKAQAEIINSEKFKLDQEIKNRSEIKKVQDSNLSTNTFINTVSQKIIEVEKLIEELKSKQKIGLNGRGKPMTENQAKNVQEQLENKEKKLEKEKLSLEKLEQQNILQQEELKNLIENTKEKFNSFSSQDISEKKEDLSSQIKELENALEKIEKEKENIERSINNHQQKIMDINHKMQEETAKAMFSLDEDLRKTGSEIEIVPSLNYEDSWPEAAQVQDKFDKSATEKTGKIVRNGGRAGSQFGTNLRDILTFIDKKKEQVQEIDVLAIFKDKIKVSKFDDFNDIQKQSNQKEDSSVVGVYGTVRQHLPLTTMFDNIKNELTSNQKNDLHRLLNQNAPFIRKLKQVFTKKFKFTKKDFWRGGQEDGNLDVRNLWKLPTKMGEDFYEVNNPKFVNKLAASIIVDISGSQDKELTGYGEKLKIMALALSEALDEVHIKHEILGYHAPISDQMRSMQSTPIYTRRSNSLETVVYKNFQQKDKLGLMNLQIQMTDNSDGESVRIASRRLLKERAKSHMMFVISDGKPFLSDTDISVLDEDLRSALRQAVQNKIKVYGIGFFKQAQEFFGSQFCHIENDNDIVEFFNKN